MTTGWVADIVDAVQDRSIREFLDGLDLETYCAFCRLVEGMAAQYRANPEPRRALFALMEVSGETLGVVVDGTEVLLFTRGDFEDWLVQAYRGLSTEEAVRRLAPALRVDVIDEKE